MMDNLRTASSHVVLKIILGLIIISFVLTGVGNYLVGANADYAAKVNGDEIGRAQLERAYASERARQQQMLGEQFSTLASNEGYMRQMRQQALSQLIDEKLLDQYASKIGLAIGDEQVKQAIFSQPAFQSNGKFDNAKYNGILANMGYTPDQYAEALRKQLTIQQLIQPIAGADFMLKGEEEALTALVSQQRLVREATLNVAALIAKQNVSDEQIKNNYAQNKASFMAPEQFRVSYIELDAAAMKTSASESEIQSWYDQHKQEYTQPERSRFSIIQTKTEADAGAVLTALKQGADFASLAKQKSIDPITARKGGDMGWLEPETMPDELKNAGLKEKGQLSGVIKSSVGYLIARLDDITPQQVKPLAEVHSQVADKVKQEKAIDAYYKLQQKVSDAASNNNTSLAGAEQAAGVKAIETDWFSHDNVPPALDFQPVTQAIFNGGLLGQNGAPGSNSDIITVDGDRAFVVRIADHKAQAVKPLFEVHDQIAQDIRRDKATQEARMQAEKLLAALKAGKGDDAMKAAKLTFGTPQTLSRTDRSPLTQSVFEMPLPSKGGVTYAVSEDGKGNLVLLALDSVKSGSLPDGQKNALVQGVIQNNAQIAFEALLSNLRQQAKIKYGSGVDVQ
ncbi:peptidylprolyl isomerase [Erwinia sp. OLTSP20]|uniref:peptidylprolyl isomerase n=1 Tax=unclassified Erwinia TaxID=2622719 RepID=UPI000C17D6F9|nr:MULTISPECIES: peptidylprolyl isomerase [unclassified Erwinia]PIJ52224.1 peptidylprolyl isomerase [Erwinia sp. OAMSP11]PIJ75733.1 peptidylprolyl isomerase [Erwinia sp. OLSSP12]PIJ81140.1 peptidylprolyl isomerase [Erwinia sp. OLMTSP26]PIJ84231.1 peptidylprolyl isomerase [Erwinia sp. OLCASP19]PIJ88696.1 peptidylprolyl isomerase [Erwinia sp. OLMDSP33]